MPGLIGKIYLSGFGDHRFVVDQVSTENHSALQGIAPGMHSISKAEGSKSSARYLDKNILVIFEGVLLGMQDSPDKIVADLYWKYLDEGEQFVKGLRGSFQIAIVDNRLTETKFFLYSDHTASRRIFFAQTPDDLYFSPDIEPLVDCIQKRTMDETAALFFMVSGHFPAGHTAIHEINTLGPGEYLVVEGETVLLRRYFRFEVQPDEQMDEQEAARELEMVLKERVIEHWQNAESPAILLSGGYDSQYIFYTIADAVVDTHKLTTVTWGEDPGKPNADMAVARQTADRFGTHHIEVIKTHGRWQTEYDEMFKAQSGMTDSSFYHAHELEVCKKLRREYGIQSVMRGDECLGFGPISYTAQNALIPNSMSFPEYVPELVGWLSDPIAGIEQYSRFMANLVDQYHCGSYDSLKDTLDFYERQNMNRNPLNNFKLHYMEVFCPLIDPDVLRVIQRFPSRFRQHKRLFSKMLETKIGKQLEIAEHNNLTDWHTVIRDSGRLKDFFIKEFDALPPFFNAEYFRSLVLAFTNGKGKNIKTIMKDLARPLKKYIPLEMARGVLEHRKRYVDQQLHIPAHMLIIRAAVLARWHKWWIA